MVDKTLHQVFSNTTRSRERIAGFNPLSKALLIALPVLCAVALQGCMVPIQPSLPATIQLGNCAGTTTLIGDSFELKISDVTRTSEIERPGLAQMKAAIRASQHSDPSTQKDLTSGLIAKAQTSFLVIPMHVTNIKNSPKSWSIYGSTGFISGGLPYYKEYKLFRTDGNRYEPDMANSSFIAATTGNNLNPGAYIDGNIVFDVPPGDYDFAIVSTTIAPGLAGVTLIDHPVLRCRLGSM